MLLRVFLGPCGVSVLVADINDVPMVGHCSCTDDTAVLGDDVAAEEHQCRLRDRARWVKRLLPPVPSFLYDVGIERVLVCVEVIDNQYIRAYGILSGATW